MPDWPPGIENLLSSQAPTSRTILMDAMTRGLAVGSRGSGFAWPTVVVSPPQGNGPMLNTRASRRFRPNGCWSVSGLTSPQAHLRCSGPRSSRSRHLCQSHTPPAGESRGFSERCTGRSRGIGHSCGSLPWWRGTSHPRPGTALPACRRCHGRNRRSPHTPRPSRRTFRISGRRRWSCSSPRSPHTCHRSRLLK